MNNFNYVNVSVCKSNIKSKKGSYFGRVCKEGCVSDEQLLQELKKRIKGMDIDTLVLEALMKKMGSVIFDFLASGYDVDFFDLGTFSLATSGQLDMKRDIRGYTPNSNEVFSDLNIEDESNDYETTQKEEVVTLCGDYDVSDAVGKNVQFKMKFKPSKEMKERLKNVKMYLAIKKKRAPVPKKIEFPIPQSTCLSPSFIQIKGEGLKVVGESGKIGIYIKEKDSGALKKIAKTAVIQNTPKNLLFMVDCGLKQGVEYSIKIVTQYIEGGASEVLRVGEASFVYECPILEDVV